MNVYISSTAKNKNDDWDQSNSLLTWFKAHVGELKPLRMLLLVMLNTITRLCLLLLYNMYVFHSKKLYFIYYQFHTVIGWMGP